MSIFDLILMSFRAILSNTLRSLLTTLGIIIGVSSVIVLMAIGQGAVKGVIDELSALGTNLIFIEPGSSEEDGQKGAAGSALTLTREDGEAIIDSKILGVDRLTSMIDFTAQAITPSNNIGTQVVGTEYTYSEIRGLELSDGRFIDIDDVEKKSLNINNSQILQMQSYLKNKDINHIIYAQKKATETVFKNKKIPFRSFEILKRDEKTLGELFTFFILETILLGRALKINPFDQPAVELIKNETKKILT